jgi:hypothetical protein
MRALCLDYQRECVPPPWLGWLLLFAALAGLGLLGTYYQDLTARNATWEARMERIDRASGSRVRVMRAPDKQEARVQLQEVRNANLVLRQLGLPWGDLFAAIETSAGANVALLAMEPDTRKGTVRITGEAKHLGDVLVFIKQLGSRPVFSRVFLQNHQTQQQDPQRPVRFSLIADWAEARP